MKIALTGGTGRVGQAIAREALRQGHEVVSIDRVAPPAGSDHVATTFIKAEVTDYDAVLAAFAGCDAVIHMAAIPAPFRHPDPEVHNNNVVGSYNALRAAVEQGITRICQASSVNAIGLSFSRTWHFDYLPLDEAHPSYNEEPYGLSKEICELQADSICRRYADVSIASMRFHLVAPREIAVEHFNHLTPEAAKHLWAYTNPVAAARACLLGITAPFKGHEVFYIVAPQTTLDVPTLEIAERFFPEVPVKGDLSGTRSFFDSSKAGRILGWTHEDAPTSG